MDKFLIRKDVYGELIEKGYGKKDLSKLTKKKITDKNGHTRTVYGRNGEQPAEMKQPKAQEGLSDEKRAKYEEMLEKVKAGSDENALFVRGEMLNKKDAIDYLEKKLGRKNGVVAEQKMKMEDEKKDAAMKDKETKSSEQMLDEKAKENFKKDAMKMSDKGLEQKIKNLTTPGSLDYQVYSNPEQIAKVFEEELNRRKGNNTAQKMANEEDKAFAESEKDAQKKYGNMSIEELKAEAKKYDGVSKYSPEAVEARKVYDILNQKLEEEKKENYLDAKNEGGKDIAENNKIETLSEKIEFSPDEMKMIRDTAKEIGYKVGKDEGKLLNAINSKDKAMYSALTKKNQKVWDESGKTQKTFSSTDLLKEKIQSMNGDFGSDDSGSIFDEEMEEDTTAKTFEDAIKNYNFTDEKKNQFAMDEVAKFYPDLKETVDKHRKAFRDVDDAKRKLGINPNNKEYQENFKNAVNELSKMNKEYESKAAKALEKTPNIPKPSFEKYMDARRKVDKFKETYKKQLEEFEVGERLRANGGAAFLNPMYGLKPNDYTKDSDYINAQMTIRAFEGK